MHQGAADLRQSCFLSACCARFFTMALSKAEVVDLCDEDCTLGGLRRFIVRWGCAIRGAWGVVHSRLKKVVFMMNLHSKPEPLAMPSEFGFASLSLLLLWLLRTLRSCRAPRGARFRWDWATSSALRLAWLRGLWLCLRLSSPGAGSVAYLFKNS